MRTKLLLLSICQVACLALCAAQKVAVADVEKIFNGYYKTKIIQSLLEEQQAVYRNHATTLNQQYRRLQEEYASLLDTAQNITLKESERQEAEKQAALKLMECKNLETEINSYLAEKGRQFKQLEEEKRLEVTGEIMAEIQRRATIEDIDIVLDSSGLSSSNLSVVVYFKPNLDITDKVLEELNRGNRVEN